MNARRRIDKRILWVLVGGFSLTILLMLTSGYIGVQAIEIVEWRNAALHEQQRLSTRVIDEIQGEEAGLSDLFYALAADPQLLDRPALLQRLDEIEHRVQKTLGAALAGSNAERWSGVKMSAGQFIAEVRRLLETPGTRWKPPASLYYAHQALLSELSSLVATDYQRAVEEETRSGQSGQDRIRQALVVLGIALVLSVACAAVTVRTALQMIHRTEWQARELSRLATHVLETQEQTLHRFSRELHDELGQTLTAIEANLAAVPATTPTQSARLEDCQLLVKDAISNVRELSQLLRPSTLDDFGLASSLQWLAESFAQRTGIEVEQQLEFEGRIGGEAETHLFRIAQEALTNVARHSGASRVTLRLAGENGVLRLSVADNGSGLPTGREPGSGFGLIGMRERMRAADGELRVQSGRAGVTLVAEVPLHGVQQKAANPSLISG